jgi:hypothetical protein
VGGNQFFGYRAGGSTTTGIANVFAGYFTGQQNTIGSYNAFYGVNTGLANTTGSSNTFLGVGAGSVSNQTGGSNIYIGRDAGNGTGSGNSNNIEIGNLGTGGDAGYIRIGTEPSQTMNTYVAGIWTNHTPNINTYVTISGVDGHLGYNTVTGGGNVMGNCLDPASGGTYLTGWVGPNLSNTVGCSFLFQQTGTNFIGIGTTNPSAALDVNGDISANSPASGPDRSSYQIAENTVLSAFGDRNIIVGFTGAHASNASQQNTFVGANAGQVNNSGDWNVFLGSASGASNTGGYENTFVGQVAGRDNVNGHDNTYIGEFAGTVSNTSGSYNTYVGEGTGQDNNNGNSNIYLMSLGTNESNTIRIGNQGTGAGQQTNTFIAGIWTGAPVPNTKIVCVDVNGQLTANSPSCLIALQGQLKTQLEQVIAQQQQQIESLQKQNAEFQQRLARLESLIAQK